jgi:hypothetical protein
VLRTASTSYLEHLEPIGDGLDLPTIDLSTASWGSSPWGSSSVANPTFDRRLFEERYAELGFGLGIAPRRQRRDDPWWETPIGMLAAIVGVLLLLALST